MPLRSFGPFRFDSTTGELWRAQRKIPLQPALARLLALLISRPGELIGRDEMVTYLWPGGVHVDYDNSLNNAVARLRRLVGARWIERIPKRGYRFRAAHVPTVTRRDPEVDRATTLGRHFWNQMTAASLDRARFWYQHAVVRDPECAPAWAGLAETWLLLADDVIGSPLRKDALLRAGEAATRALSLAPNCATALAVSGMVCWRKAWDWEEAERRLREAIAADPSSAVSRLFYAWLLGASRRGAPSIEQLRRAVELAPASPFVNANAGLLLYFDRKPSAATVQLNESLALDPHFPLAWLFLGMAQSGCGDNTRAVHSLRRAAGLAGTDSGHYQAVLGYAEATLGTPRQQDATNAYAGALVRLGAGEIGQAVDLLERAAQEHCSYLPFLSVDPMFDRLRRERRFRSLVRSIGLSE